MRNRMSELPLRSGMKMLGVRLTQEEKHMVRLRALMEHKTVRELIKERLADILKVKN